MNREKRTIFKKEFEGKDSAIDFEECFEYQVIISVYFLVTPNKREED
jgi:hypothetical protein